MEGVITPMNSNQQMTATPRRPAAYLRVAARAITTPDRSIQRQRHEVLSAAAELGWPEPAVYTDAGTQDGTGPALAWPAWPPRSGSANTTP
jgi:hypothetical protein